MYHAPIGSIDIPDDIPVKGAAAKQNPTDNTQDKESHGNDDSTTETQAEEQRNPFVEQIISRLGHELPEQIVAALLAHEAAVTPSTQVPQVPSRAVDAWIQKAKDAVQAAVGLYVVTTCLMEAAMDTWTAPTPSEADHLAEVKETLSRLLRGFQDEASEIVDWDEAVHRAVEGAAGEICRNFAP